MSEMIIVGAGIAGLAAAEALVGEGLGVIILEARDRIGGRIYTSAGKAGRWPIELGAEFVHGAKNDLWPIIEDARVAAQEVPDRHWVFSDGALKEEKNFYNPLEEVISRIDMGTPDLDFSSFLKRHKHLPQSSKVLAREYVEGFHAADPKKVSSHALVKAEKASEKDEGNRQFRIASGYATILDWLHKRVVQRGGEFRLNTIVKRIHWDPGAVAVEARTAGKRKLFNAQQVLITLPIGVLQHRGQGGIVFDPRIPTKERAISSLTMGRVIKVGLEFRSRFWQPANFGFIHHIGAPLPTWWSDNRGPLLTAWSGGPRTEPLARMGPDELEEQSLCSLAKIFKKDLGYVRDLLVACHRHDWSEDPFSRGAYSYTPAGKLGMAAEIAAPVQNSLFFAGEATDSKGEQGTVHGALASGRRAAKEMLWALRHNHSGKYKSKPGASLREARLGRQRARLRLA